MKHKLIKSIITLLICFLLASSFASADQPILAIDTGGHMALIIKIIPMRDGRHVLSVSADKTIRIWDVESGKETQRILGQIGGGLHGMIFSAALTPDQRYLAVGGFLAENPVEGSAIRIYDLKTGTLSKVLKSHRDAVFDLSISSDGRYLVSGSADMTVKVWNIGDNFSLVSNLKGHNAQVYAVKIFKDIDDYKIVSAGYDNKVIIWSLNTELNSFTHSDKLQYLAISEKFIAASGPSGNKILIFDHNLNKIREISSETNPAGLSFSPDGRLLLTGSGTSPDVSNVYDSQDSFRKITSFNKHDNTTMAVTFLDNHTAVTGGGANNDIYIWDGYTGQVKKHISGHGKRVWSIGINGREIGFGNTGLPPEVIHEHTGILEKTINLDSFLVGNITNTKKFKRMNLGYQQYSLNHRQGRQYDYQDTVIVISENGREIGQITRDSTNGYRHNTYGFTQDGVIISGGANGFLAAYNTQGQPIAQFIGHTGEVWGIASDRDTLVSGSEDQTIRLWNLRDLKSGRNKIFPIISIFISDDNEWVVYNNEGFFNASPKGDQYVGWHVNKGAENAAEFYTAKQFRRFLYRPDIIQKTIELGGSKLAIDEIAKTEPSIRDITVENLITRAPVDVRISDLNVKKDNKAEVTIQLGKNNTTPPERITLFVNGAQQLKETERSLKGAKPGDDLKYLVTLPDRKNTVKVTVENQWAENSNEKVFDNPSGNYIKITKESTLYVIAVGISHYPLLPLNNQLKSPPLDARSIAEHFKRLEGKLYRKVDVKALADDKNLIITSHMVEQALIEQTKKAGPLDTTIIFLAGHGATDSMGSYHFITADTKTSGGLKEGTGVSDLDWSRLHNIIDNTMGRRVVIVDTCQAGEVFSGSKTDIKRLVKDIHDVNAIVYSGTSRQESGHEISKGGVFTLSMVSGFEGNAVYEAGLLPFLRLKDYVDKEVPRLNRDIMLGLYRAVKIKEKTDEEVIDSVQRPVAVVPDGMERFIIYAK